MSSLAWLALSWTIVAAACYYVVFKLGLQSPEDEYVKSTDASTTHAEPTYTSVRPSEASDVNKWANVIIKWFNDYSGTKLTRLQSEVLNALDESARRLLQNEQYDFKFSQSDNEEGQISAPIISNAQLTPGPSNQISARAHLRISRAALKFQISKRQTDRYIVNHYEAILSNIDANIDTRVASIAGQTHVIVCFSQTPTSELVLYDTEQGRITGPEAATIHDILNKAIGASITDLKLSSLTGDTEVHTPASNLSGISDLSTKRFFQTNQKSAHNLPPLPSLNNNNRPNVLHVTVIQGIDLNIHEADEQPFVVAEIDEPEQKYITQLGVTRNPMWNDVFAFDLSNNSDEVLFEVYNKNPHFNGESTFLGLAIVGISELLRTRSSVQYLKLQSRPNMKDEVTGNLQVKFDFSHDDRLQQIGTQSSQVLLSNRRGERVSETIAHHTRPLSAGLGDGLPHSKLAEPIQSNTMTVTIRGIQVPQGQLKSHDVDNYTAYDPHEGQKLNNNESFDKYQNNHEYVNQRSPVQKSPVQQQQFFSQPSPTQRNAPTQFYQTPSQQSYYAQQSPTLKTPSSQFSDPFEQRSVSNQQTKPVSTPDSLNQSYQYASDIEEAPLYKSATLDSRRSTSEKRNRERSFFGDLKDRLSKKRRSYQGRSRSADPMSRSLYETESAPPSRDVSTGPYYRDYDNYAKYTGDENAKCSLVLELPRGNEHQYFLIPPSIAREPAAASILRKGKKLHICKNHTFVAVKSTCGLVCNTCNTKIPTGFNKQAYQCRTCRTVCHKGCHLDVPEFCHINNPLSISMAKDVDWAHCLSHDQIEEYISAENL